MKIRRVLIIVTLICALVMAAAGVASISAPSDNEPEVKDAYHYIGRAEFYYQDGEYEMALASYQKALELDEESTAALHGEALSRSALGHKEETIAVYEKLVEALPEDPEIQLEYVNAMVVGGYLEAAKTTLEDLMDVFDNEKMEQLYEQMTVSMPQADLEPGSYDSYQLLNMTSGGSSAAIYYTTDGSEPDSSSNVYAQCLVVSEPETVIKAKCINYLGYESEVVELRYIIDVPVKEVLKQDFSSLSQAVRETMNVSYNQPLYNYQLAQIRSLHIIGEGYYSDPDATVFYATSYNPGNYIANMTERGDGDLSHLKYMPFLEELVICWQGSVSLEPIAQLQHLKNLSLLNNNIKDIAPLAKLTGLEKLSLGWNRIKDISPLSGMTDLVSLGLWNNKIADISPLAKLSKLQYLDIANNKVSSLDALAGLSELEEFWANGNQITSIAPLDPEGVLKVLMMSGNPIEDYQVWKQTHPRLLRTDILD